MHAKQILMRRDTWKYGSSNTEKQTHSLPVLCTTKSPIIHSWRSSWRIYWPLSLPCITSKAIAKNSFSSFVWLVFNPVATEALGFRPAYMTCLWSWCSVWFRSVSIRGWTNDQAPALRGSSWAQTMVLALGYWSRFSLSCCHGNGFNCSTRVIAVPSILLSCLYL